MGGGNWVKELDSVSLTPESALSVENKIEKFKLKKKLGVALISKLCFGVELEPKLKVDTFI